MIRGSRSTLQTLVFAFVCSCKGCTGQFCSNQEGEVIMSSDFRPPPHFPLMLLPGHTSKFGFPDDIHFILMCTHFQTIWTVWADLAGWYLHRICRSPLCKINSVELPRAPSWKNQLKIALCFRGISCRFGIITVQESSCYYKDGSKEKDTGWHKILQPKIGYNCWQYYG